jgi:hypothetical protein
MPIHAGAANRSTTVDPAKLLAIVRRWCPGAPVEVPITLVKALMEAAASGGSGELRLGLLEDFVLGLAAQLCSNGHKIEKLKKETARMAGDPLRRPKLRPGHRAELARAALAAVERANDQELSHEKVHTALRRLKPKIRKTSTYALLKRMTDCGWLERVDAGVYGLPGRLRKPYEARTFQLFQLVYTAPDHEMGIRQAAAALDWSPKLLGATASELSRRNLLESVEEQRKGVLVVPREIEDKLARGEGVLIAPGKMFYGPAGGPRVDHSAFTTLRVDRPRVDLAQEISQLRMLRKRELDSALDEAAPRLGIPRANLEIMVKPPPATAKAAQRRKTQTAAKEQLRVELLRLVGEQPETLPPKKDDLCERFCSPVSESKISGLTREIFREVWTEVAPAGWRKRGPRASKFRPKISA